MQLPLKENVGPQLKAKLEGDALKGKVNEMSRNVDVW